MSETSILMKFMANLIALRSSPLNFLHEIFCAQSLQEVLGLPTVLASKRSAINPQTNSFLHGYRVKRYPLMALTTQRSMGPSRHILSQRVVAGTMTVSPPLTPPKQHI